MHVVLLLSASRMQRVRRKETLRLCHDGWWAGSGDGLWGAVDWWWRGCVECHVAGATTQAKLTALRRRTSWHHRGALDCRNITCHNAVRIA